MSTFTYAGLGEGVRLHVEDYIMDGQSRVHMRPANFVLFARADPSCLPLVAEIASTIAPINAMIPADKIRDHPDAVLTRVLQIDMYAEFNEAVYEAVAKLTVACGITHYELENMDFCKSDFVKHLKPLGVIFVIDDAWFPYALDLDGRAMREVMRVYGPYRTCVRPMVWDAKRASRVGAIYGESCAENAFDINAIAAVALHPYGKYNPAGEEITAAFVKAANKAYAAKKSKMAVA